MTADPVPFKPWNRTGVKPLGERWFGDGEWDWFVDDIDSHANPIAFRSTRSAWRVLPNHIPSGIRYVICTDRGMYVRHPSTGHKQPPVRRFATPAAAARFVREHRLGVPDEA